MQIDVRALVDIQYIEMIGNSPVEIALFTVGKESNCVIKEMQIRDTVRFLIHINRIFFFKYPKLR